ncbi:hypothetical protein BGZ54_009178 [Gamsiella multidivaricata]|nr:hypothetical protein BGZ54_009178 [Gamsiella multidivaricata]
MSSKESEHTPQPQERGANPVDYKRFYDETAARRISLRTFMEKFPDIQSKERLISLWTGKILPYLTTHNDTSKKRIGAHLAKEKIEDLNRIIDEGLATNDSIRFRIAVKLTRLEHKSSSVPLLASSKEPAAKSKEPAIGSPSPDLMVNRSISSTVQQLPSAASRNNSAVSPSSPRPRHDHGRRSSLSPVDPADVSALYVNSASLSTYKYLVESINVGRSFHNLQLIAIDIVSDFDKRTTLENIHNFLSLNYIWDMSKSLPGVQPTVHEKLRQLYAWPRATLSSNVIQLCATLDQQLSDGVNFDVDVNTKELKFVKLLYEMLALKLSLEYHCFEKDLEDTFCHAALDTLFSLYFPKKGKYVLDWANKETEGPKERRKNGYKPDAIISRGCREIAFVEDSINSHFGQGFDIRKVAAVQVFGHKVTLHTMIYRNGVYHWCQSCFAYLPCDQNDTGRIPSCLRLLASLNFLDGIDTEVLLNTPPRIEYDDDEEEMFDTGPPSKVTPTTRNNMF